MTDPASWGDGYRAGHEQARIEAKAWCQHVRKMTDQCLEADMLPHGIHSSCYYINACPYLVAAPPPSTPEGVSGDSELERVKRLEKVAEAVKNRPMRVRWDSPELIAWFDRVTQLAFEVTLGREGKG